METKVKLKYMDKPIEAYCKHDCRNGKDCWTFRTDEKEIVVASSNLPITPPVGQRPVKIRPARLKRRLQAGRIIHYQDCCEISGGIKNCDLFNKAKRQMSLKDAATIAAASNLLKTLKRYDDGTIMPVRGGQSIDRFINGFHHEAVFQDGRAVLVTVTENAIVPEKAENKRARVDTDAPLAQYVFRRMGNKDDFWEIVFEGTELTPVRHLAGMTYIRALLAEPGKPFFSKTLYELEKTPPPEVVTPSSTNALSVEERAGYGTSSKATPVIDNKTRIAIQTRIKELQDELKEPNLTVAEKEYREEYLEKCNAALKSACVSKHTGGAIMEAKEIKQPRQTVSKAIDRAIASIAKKKNGHKLGQHFKAIHKGTTLCYVGTLTWKT